MEISSALLHLPLFLRPTLHQLHLFSRGFLVTRYVLSTSTCTYTFLLRYCKYLAFLADWVHQSALLISILQVHAVELLILYYNFLRQIALGAHHVKPLSNFTMLALKSIQPVINFHSSYTRTKYLLRVVLLYSIVFSIQCYSRTGFEKSRTNSATTDSRVAHLKSISPPNQTSSFGQLALIIATLFGSATCFHGYRDSLLCLIP